MRMTSGASALRVGGQTYNFNPGQEVSIGELAEAQRALHASERQYLTELNRLRKSAPSGMGFAPNAVNFDSNTSPGGTFAPLAPMSMSGVLTNLAFDPDSDLVTWKMMPQESALSTVHQYNARTSYGSSRTSAFVAESRVPAISQSEFQRKTVRMRFMAEFRQISNVAEYSTILGFADALALESSDGLVDLLYKIEGAMYWGNSAANPLEFDGLYYGIKNGTNGKHVKNKNGNTVTAQEFNAWCTELLLSPNNGRPSVILIEPEPYTNIVNSILSQYVKIEMPDSPSKNVFFWLGGVLHVGTTAGVIPIISVKLMRPYRNPITGTEGDGPPAALSGGLLPTLTEVAAPITNSEWEAADEARDWYVVVEASGDEGVVASGILGPVQPPAGGAIQVDVNDSGVPKSGTGSIRTYEIFAHSVVAGATAPTDRDLFKPAGRFGRNAANASDTRFNWLREFIPGTANAVILTKRVESIAWVKFLDPTRRQVFAARQATSQFMLQIFGALEIKAPYQHMWIKNIGF